jgi:ATP-dependent Lon protease
MNKTSIIKKINDKLQYYLELLENTYKSTNNYNTYKIYNDHIDCIHKLNNIYSLIQNININDDYINQHDIDIIKKYTPVLQEINDLFSSVFTKFGTMFINDIIQISIGNTFITKLQQTNNDLYSLLNKYCRPINFIYKESFNDSNQSDNIDIVLDDLIYNSNNFYIKTYGINIEIKFTENNKTKICIINSLVDNIPIFYINNTIVKDKIYFLQNNFPNIDFDDIDSIYKQYIHSLSLKDILIYKNKEYYERFHGLLNKIRLFKQISINDYIRDFMKDDLYTKRNKIILLLLNYNDTEYKHTSYLLYDLLDNEFQKKNLYNSLPYTIQMNLKNTMKSYLNNKNDDNNNDNNEFELPYEKKIQLMKVSNEIKSKAFTKLKEINGRNSEISNKARSFLDGLLKIPFGIYKKEDKLEYIHKLKLSFKKFIELYYHFLSNTLKIDIEQRIYSIPELQIYISQIKNIILFSDFINNDNNNLIKDILYNLNNKQLKIICKTINNLNKDIDKYIIKQNSENNKHFIEPLKNIKLTNNTNHNFINYISKYINAYYKRVNKHFHIKLNSLLFNYSDYCNFHNDFLLIENDFLQISKELENINDIMDKSIYGHTKAKRQIQRVIAQWMSGEQRGYSFGFEGPPGVGKCHAYGSEILMYDGSIKEVQDIVVGDLLMGDDSTPRKVLSLATGYDIMYSIVFPNKEYFTVNQEHILCLKFIGKPQYIKRYTIKNKVYYITYIFDYLNLCYVSTIFNNRYDANKYIINNKVNCNNIIEISVKKYLTLDNKIKKLLNCYKTSVDFKIYNKSNTIIHPYNYGYNIVKKYKNINKISKNYLINSKIQRLLLLNGIIDSLLIKGTIGQVKLKLYKVELIHDIIFLVNSLGYHIDYNFKYYKIPCYIINIYGKYINKLNNYVYNLLSGIYINNDHVHTLYEFKVEKESELPNKYYGFELDGNKRYVMGDFIVTHNTSLAKNGLSKCLVDNNGNKRPFTFIALGGSTNGSTLDGHNYTYLGSSWGKIVDTLIQSKCMNPIIFIDELDKVSNTEQGREIISILTHLIDTTQNNKFQDKYFSGIDLDLSKVLFIFSYNDVNLIDKILLDRIHRIKFDNLTIQDKIIICNDFILPEIYSSINIDKKFIIITNEILQFIIENYTYEPGIRKLKEILFEIIGEINIELLNQTIQNIPIQLTICDIKNKYLKDRIQIKHSFIHNKPTVGIINGLWANSLGFGGIIPIQSIFYPSDVFLDFKLTGLQGDIMKESMNVSKTLAFNLTSTIKQQLLIQHFKTTKMQGIHIHCPQGATPKDGPSAGVAITISIYSLLNNKKIKNDVGITGEINLQGNITAIGGLDLKILGGLKSGIKTFIYPTENKKDFDNFIHKYNNKLNLDSIKFIDVHNIKQVLKLVF